MPRSRRPALETLEGRDLPAAFGVPWPDARHLTLSFAPDGTDVGGQASALFRQLDAIMPTEAWQREVLRAFQTWGAVAQVDFALVGDDGSAFGAPGALQGNATVGDVRIGSRALSAQTYAATTPPDQIDSWAGDVVLNGLAKFAAGGVGGADLYTVMLQEAGHALGLANSADPKSVMYDTYKGVRTKLEDPEIKAVQALYGKRDKDAFDAAGDNHDTGHASLLAFATGVPGVGVADATLTDTKDVDYYKVVTPKGAPGGFTVFLRTSGLSLMTGRVTVNDDKQNVVASATATDPLRGDLALLVANAKGGSTFYVRVDGAKDDAFGVGAYRIAVGSNAQAAASDAFAGLVADDAHGNDTLAKATALTRVIGTVDARTDYSLKASLTDAADVDYYRVQAPAGVKGGDFALVVTVWAAEAGRVSPTVAVYDAAGKEVPSRVLLNDANNFSVQVANATPGAVYYVKVGNASASGLGGNYLLSIDFRSQQTALAQLASGTLDAVESQQVRGLATSEAQLMHFELSAADWDNAAAKAGVRLTIYDAAGQAVFTLLAAEGMTSVGDVWLAAGTYTLRFAAGTADGSALPLTYFNFVGGARSDSVGVQPTDPTLKAPAPAPAPAAAPPPVTAPPPPTPSTSLWTFTPTPSSTGYYLGLKDPYAVPFWQ